MWTLELPPLLSAAVQVAGVAAVAARNPRVCAAPYLQHPHNRRLLGRVYRLLQPAVAPLEPLLGAAGVSGENSLGRQCICGEPAARCCTLHGQSTGRLARRRGRGGVDTPWRAPTPQACRTLSPPFPAALLRAVLTVLQFWGALLLPVVLATRGQLLAYLDWRRQRLGRQRAQRRQTRGLLAGPPPNPALAAAAAPNSGSTSAKSSPASVTAGSPGGQRPGSANTSSSSGRSSLSSDSLDDPAGLFGSPLNLSLAQLLKPARRGGRPHPDDVSLRCWGGGGSGGLCACVRATAAAIRRGAPCSACPGQQRRFSSSLARPPPLRSPPTPTPPPTPHPPLFPAVAVGVRGPPDGGPASVLAAAGAAERGRGADVVLARHALPRPRRVSGGAGAPASLGSTALRPPPATACGCAAAARRGRHPGAPSRPPFLLPQPQGGVLVPFSIRSCL